MAKESYETYLNEIFDELKNAHQNNDEILAFGLIAEINRVKNLMAATTQS